MVKIQEQNWTVLWCSWEFLGEFSGMGWLPIWSERNGGAQLGLWGGWYSLQESTKVSKWGVLGKDEWRGERGLKMCAVGDNLVDGCVSGM